LLVAARSLMADVPASQITSRMLAKEAGVHHTLVSYTHGGVTALLAAAFEQEQTEIVSALPDLLFGDTGCLSDASAQSYWRAYSYLTLDAKTPALQSILETGDPIAALTRLQETRFETREVGTRRQIAIAWWSAQVGALIFARPLNKGLSIAERDLPVVRRKASGKLQELLQRAPDRLPQGIYSERVQETEASMQGLEDNPSKMRLIDAATELLQERGASGISGRELARRAGVNYGLIHHYFGSKEAVFDETFITLHGRYVRDMVAEDTQRLAAAFRMRNHEAFLRIWAYRELANDEMPIVDLKGMRLLLDTIVSQRKIKPRRGDAYTDAQASAYCSLALQLGWVICRRNLLAAGKAPENEILSGLSAIARWFTTNNWTTPSA